MNWFERKIRRYEHRRWAHRVNRRVQPFHWGLEYIGGSPDEPNPGAFVRQYANQAIENSRDWYAVSPAADYRLDSENVLTFTSSIESPWPENNIVHAQLFPARKAGLEPADQICGPNIGLTLQANRQAVQDARRCLHWLEQQGYTKLGILGTSIGSSVGYITLVHDERVRAGGFFPVSTYYADVISQGMTTNHVWEGLRQHVTVDELREYWAPISPMPYVERGMGAGRNTFMVYGKYDPTMLPELTRQMLDSLRRHGADPRTLELPCGHYSLELAPFSYIAGYRMLTFFLESLA